LYHVNLIDGIGSGKASVTKRAHNIQWEYTGTHGRRRSFTFSGAIHENGRFVCAAPSSCVQAQSWLGSFTEARSYINWKTVSSYGSPYRFSALKFAVSTIKRTERLQKNAGELIMTSSPLGLIEVSTYFNHCTYYWSWLFILKPKPWIWTLGAKKARPSLLSGLSED